jgi:hypothetical protein
MSDKIYKHWKILRQDPNSKCKYICLCLLCNTEHSVFKCNLYRKNSYYCCKSCSASRERAHQWKGFGDVHGKFMYVLNRIAKLRNLELNVAIEYIDGLLKLQNYKCAISGMDIKLVTENSKYECTASLDRIDSSKGYVIDNVQWVHKHINKMKQDFNQDLFIELCKKVANNHG